MGNPQAIFSQGGQSGLFKYPMMFFAKKNDKNTSDSSSSNEEVKKTKRGSSAKDEDKTLKIKETKKAAVETPSVETAAPIKRRRGSTKKGSDTTETSKSSSDAKTQSKDKKSDIPEIHKLYTLKFNSPILPFAKFPLTQNKYIQDFLRKYEEDKDHV